MICFGAKTDQEVKEKVTCWSHLKIKTKNKQILKEKRKFAEREREREKQSERNIFFIFFFSHFSLRYTEIGPSEFVGA